MKTNSLTILKSNRVPEYGDIVWLDFSPQVGHEEAGNRPWVVISPSVYNGKAGLALLCPITSRIKDRLFEVQVPTGMAVHGVILADQVKSLDWHAWEIEHPDKLPESVVKQISMKINALMIPCLEGRNTVNHKYVPKCGDVMQIDFPSQVEPEQVNRRLAVILSPATYNKDLALLCPITSQVNGDASEVSLPTGIAVNGVILTGQVTSLDWDARHAKYITTLPMSVVKQVSKKLTASLN